MSLVSQPRKRVQVGETPAAKFQSSDLLQLPEEILEAIAKCLDGKAKNALRQTCHMLRKACNNSTTAVLLEYSGKTTGQTAKVEKSTERRVEVHRTNPKCSSYGVSSLLKELKSPALHIYAEQAENARGCPQHAWNRTLAAVATAFMHARKAVVSCPTDSDLQLFGVTALKQLSVLNLTSLKLKPYLPPQAFASLVNLSLLHTLKLRHVVLPAPEVLQTTLQSLEHLHTLHLSGTALRGGMAALVEDQDIRVTAQHLAAIAQCGCPLVDLELRGFKFHGDGASWETGLATVSELQGLTRLSIVSRPRHLGPQSNIGSCALLTAVASLARLKELCLHVGYCAWCSGEQACYSCLRALPAVRASLGTYINPQITVCFPALERLNLHNGYGFNVWVTPLCMWMSNAPMLKLVTVSMYVIDPRLQELSALGNVEVHLRWLMPYSMERLLPLVRLPNLTVLSLDSTREGVMLRDGHFLSALTTLTRLEFLGQAAWDDPMPPHHYLATLANLQVKAVPGYLTDNLAGAGDVAPLLKLCRQNLKGRIGGLTFEGPPNPAYAITLQHVASWSHQNQQAILEAQGLEVVVTMVQQEFGHFGLQRLTGSLVHWLGTLAILTGLKAACDALMPNIGVLFKVLDHCLERDRAPVRHAIITDAQFEVLDKCKVLGVQIFKNLVAIGGYTEKIAVFGSVGGIDSMVRLITRRGSDATKAGAADLLATFGSHTWLRHLIIERGGISALWAVVDNMRDKHCKAQVEAALRSLNVYD